MRAIEYFPFPLSSSRHFEDTTDNEVIVAIEPIDAVDAIKTLFEAIEDITENTKDILKTLMILKT